MKYRYLKIVAILFCSLLFAEQGLTIDLSKNFNFTGVLLNDTTGAAMSGPVSITFQIYDPTGTCLLYQESHSSVTLSSDGEFSVNVGTGTRASAATDGGLLWRNIFQNDTQVRAAATSNCTSGYTPSAYESRKLRVTVNSVVLSPDYDMAAVPMANVAESLQGKTVSDFVPAAGNSSISGPIKMSSQNEFRFGDSASNYIGIKAPTTVGTNYVMTLPSDAGTSGYVLTTDGAGILSWTAPGGGGGGGSGITSLNGLTGTSQTLSVGTSGLTPAWSSTASNHTLNIPMAGTASVTAGLISNTDYNNFSSKEPALGFVPVNKAGDTITGALNITGALGVTGVLSMSANIDMGTSNKIVNIANPVATYDVANKNYVDTQLASYMSMSGGTMSGPLHVSYAGMAAAPGLIVGSDPDTGIFSPATDELAISSNGTEAFRVNSTGSVGIGTAAPAAKLDVNGTVKIGIGGAPITTVKSILVSGVSCTPGTISASGTGSCTGALTGYNVGDNVAIMCHPQTAPAYAMIFSCYISAANQITIAIQNTGGAGLTPPANWNVTVIKF